MSKKLIFKYVIIFILIGLCFYQKQLFFPTVSVVMPVYNREKLVTRAIDSILAQTYKDFEFIIVDDGSTDSTPQILKNYARLDKRIKILKNKRNKGISFSRNRGLDAARGEFVAIMDSDDFSLPDRLLKSVTFMRDHPDIDAMTGYVAKLDDTVNLTALPKNDPTYSIIHDKGHYNVELLYKNSFQNIAAMFRRSFATKHNIRYKITYKAAEDWDFWLQFVHHNANMVSLGEVLSFIRLHGTNKPDYYVDMIKRSTEIKRKNFAPFFTPQSHELPYTYTEVELCDILRKIIDANEKKHLIPQEYLNDYYIKHCPQSEDWYFLKHTQWKGFIEKLFDNRWGRINEHAKSKGTVQIFPDKIVIHWDNYAPEEFYKVNDREYQSTPFDKKINLIHYYWQDTFLYDGATAKGYRYRSNDSGVVSFDETQKTATINWDNFGSETFEYDPKTDAYVLKRR